MLSMASLREKESDIQKAILDYLKIRKIVAWRNNSGTAQVKMGQREYWMRLAPKGTSDIIGYLPDGRFLAIEVKTKTGVPTPEQREFINNVRIAGGLAFVATSIDDVQTYLKHQGF